MLKAKPWKGNGLEGEWEISLKIDGVRMLRDGEGNPVSRAGKPLYNLEGIPQEITDCEVFLKDWETSVSLVRTKNGGRKVKVDEVYSLEPLDERLRIGLFTSVTARIVEAFLQDALKKCYEGLVLRQGDTWLKVKPKETYDVPVTELIEGKGKHKGRLGAFMTPMGKVGTGFTDKQREELLDLPYGTIIEVDCMSVTKNGKFRHPRFIRVRFDKTFNEVT